MKFGISSLLAALLLSCSAGAFAQQAGAKPEQQIKWRQSVYQVLGWNSGRIKANVDGQYNKDEVVRAANAIAALANSGIGSLFGPGTETGKGWKETATKPEFFKNPQKVGELAGNFNREANELAKVAATGDAAAVKAQFGNLGKACKACHDDFKAKD
ncbi:c-type cytochrome [Ferribacterium limneticum]|uniref:c-type cytochrome n=1 Tax=Ferribacterium limneticum TaxID=76259 RepID=UPI001CFBF18C|nr:cytochrome c [Ferribacterium limneticum]UCV20098.1 cytochrome c [Ferribacterium limneticum]